MLSSATFRAPLLQDVLPSGPDPVTRTSGCGRLASVSPGSEHRLGLFRGARVTSGKTLSFSATRCLTLGDNSPSSCQPRTSCPQLPSLHPVFCDTPTDGLARAPQCHHTVQYSELVTRGGVGRKGEARVFLPSDLTAPPPPPHPCLGELFW